jgi:MtN3 and saliva related transmembrane protein
MTLSLPDSVGFAATACSMASFTPQIVKIWTQRDASSVSLGMYVVAFVGFTCWTAYGVLIGSWPVAVSNAVCLLLTSVILALVRRFGRHTEGRPPPSAARFPCGWSAPNHGLATLGHNAPGYAGISHTPTPRRP